MSKTTTKTTTTSNLFLPSNFKTNENLASENENQILIIDNKNNKNLIVISENTGNDLKLYS